MFRHRVSVARGSQKLGKSRGMDQEVGLGRNVRNRRVESFRCLVCLKPKKRGVGVPLARQVRRTDVLCTAGRA